MTAAVLAHSLPRIAVTPDGDAGAASDAVAVAASVGLDLDPWQRYVLEHAMRQRSDGRWAAFEFALVVPRQNGKNVVLEARELAGLFILGERLLIHTAHEYKAAREAFLRMVGLLRESELWPLCKVRTANGEESIETTLGTRLRYLARSAGSGRGFSADFAAFDEAFALRHEQTAAVIPTMAARPNPQVWYTSSTGNDMSEQLTTVRERALSGAAGRLCYLEWAADPDADLDDRAQWRQANPALGVRIDPEFLAVARNAMGEEEYAREHLGLWAATGGRSVIPQDVWQALVDRRSGIVERPVFAVDVTPEGTASLVVGGRNADGRTHVELVPSAASGEYLSGSAWAPRRIADLVAEHNAVAVGLDTAAQAGGLLDEVKRELDGAVPVEAVSGNRMARACAALLAGCNEGRIVHVGQPPLAVAVDAGRRQRVADAWRWHRRDTGSDISPLVAATIAAHLVVSAPQAPPAARGGGIW